MMWRLASVDGVLGDFANSKGLEGLHAWLATQDMPALHELMNDGFTDMLPELSAELSDAHIDDPDLQECLEALRAATKQAEELIILTADEGGDDMRAAGEAQGHPFRGNQWTKLGASFKNTYLYRDGKYYGTRAQMEAIAAKIPGSTVVWGEGVTYQVVSKAGKVFGPEGFVVKAVPPGTPPKVDVVPPKPPLPPGTKELVVTKVPPRLPKVSGGFVLDPQTYPPKPIEYSPIPAPEPITPENFPMKVTEPGQSTLVTWKVRGQSILVAIHGGVPLDVQRKAAESLAKMPAELITLSGSKKAPLTMILQPDIVINRAVSTRPDLQPGWKAGGLFSHGGAGKVPYETTGFNTMTLPANSEGREFDRIVPHELGHGVQYNAIRYFGSKVVRQAFREDRAELVRGKSSYRQGDYREFAYYRQNWKEMHTEGVASYITISRAKSDWRSVSPEALSRAERYVSAHPRMMRVVEHGMLQILKKKKLRAAGEAEGHPFRGNQWTKLGASFNRFDSKDGVYRGSYGQMEEIQAKIPGSRIVEGEGGYFHVVSKTGKGFGPRGFVDAPKDDRPPKVVPPPEPPKRIIPIPVGLTPPPTSDEIGFAIAMPNRKLDPDDFPLVTDFKEGEQSRRVEWHVGGVPVQVRIDRDVPINVQVQAAEALNSFPESFVRAAGSEYSSLNLRLVPEIVIGRGVKMAGLESGWKAGGLFTSGFNTVTLPANFGGLDFQRVLAHELGHGMQYNSMPSFSQRNVAAAYTADRKQIERDRYSPGIKSTAYSEFSYFRQSSKEMHAEMVAAHTLISMGAAGRYVDRGKLERARRYRDAHPHMFEVVNTGLHRINKKRQRA